MVRDRGTKTVHWDSEGTLRDEALERGFARCDAAAFEHAYERFSPRMYSSAMRILNDRPLAMECVQDVMLRLWRKRDAYSPQRGSLEAFLVVCVRNAALQRVRDDKRRKILLAQRGPARNISVDRDPFENEHVSSAISKLPRAHVEVLELAYYRGLTFNEVAQTLNAPPGTVKSRISAALRALRTLLREEAPQ